MEKALELSFLTVFSRAVKESKEKEADDGELVNCDKR